MRIVDACEIAQPIASPIRNAHIDFSKMTTSLVAVVTDVVRNGQRVVGYGFNSNGRYGQGGLIRERFRTRMLEAARNLLRHGGLRPDRDWLQFDCALSYGLVEYLRTLEVLRQFGWSPARCIPHGGHQLSLNIAAGLGLGGKRAIQTCFSPTAAFPMACR